MVFGRAALLVSIALVASACSGASTPASTAIEPADGHVIPNEGGANEGHTPTAFGGMGTGLFAGDNLNPSFPEGVGVQLYLTFALPTDIDVGSASFIQMLFTSPEHLSRILGSFSSSRSGTQHFALISSTLRPRAAQPSARPPAMHRCVGNMSGHLID